MNTFGVLFIALLSISVAVTFYLSKNTLIFTETTSVRPIEIVKNCSKDVPKGKRPFEKYLILYGYTGKHKCFPHVNDSDLPRHHIDMAVFRCDKDDPQPMADNARATTYRTRLHIYCNKDNTQAMMEERTVTFAQQVQTFRTKEEKACLHQYVRQRCYDDHPVPDVIHLVLYGKRELNLRSYIGLYSLFTVAKPCLVILHGNVIPTGPMWDAILPAAYNLVYVHQDPQTHVQGRPIKNAANQADIGRLRVLLKYGGIYLDTDMVIIQKLDIFRDVQFAANIQGIDRQLSNAIMFSVPGHPLLKIWLRKFKTYNGRSWSSHSVEMLTKLAKKYPHLISRLGPIFIKFGWLADKRMYKESCSLHESYAAHPYNHGYPGYSNVTAIKALNSTFGRLARFVLFGDPKLC